MSAEAAGSPVLTWTVDSSGRRKRIVHASVSCRDRTFCGTCYKLDLDDQDLALPGLVGSAIHPDDKPMTTAPPAGPPQPDARIATCVQLN